MASARAPVVRLIQSDPKVDRRYLVRISAFASDDKIRDRTMTSLRSRNALSASLDVVFRIVLNFHQPNCCWGSGNVDRIERSFSGRRRGLQSTVSKFGIS